jgi:hypothetical protein
MRFHSTATFILLLILLTASKHTFSQSKPYDYNKTTAIILYSGNGIVYADFEAFFVLKDYINKQATKMMPLGQNQQELEFLLKEPNYSLMLINPRQKQLIHLGEGWISDGKNWGTFDTDAKYQRVIESYLRSRIKGSGNKPLDLTSIEKTISSFEGYQGDYAKNSQLDELSRTAMNKSDSQIPDVSRMQDSIQNRSIPTSQNSREFQSSTSALISNSSKSSESSIRSNSAEVQILASTPSTINQNQKQKQNSIQDSNTQASASTETPFPIRNALLFASGLFLLWLFFHNPK